MDNENYEELDQFRQFADDIRGKLEDEGILQKIKVHIQRDFIEGSMNPTHFKMFSRLN